MSCASLLALTRSFRNHGPGRVSSRDGVKASGCVAVKVVLRLFIQSMYSPTFFQQALIEVFEHKTVHLGVHEAQVGAALEQVQVPA